MVVAHFKNIHKEIILLIKKAEFDIRICVAWFTDFEIYKELVKKQLQGINVNVVIANHIFNKKSKVDFRELLNANGKVCYIGNINDGAKDKFMHNKFCIIDDLIIITGSYNWSYKARFNDENILVITNEKKLISQFNKKFHELNPQYELAMNNNQVMLQHIEVIVNKWNNKTQTKKNFIRVNDISDKF